MTTKNSYIILSCDKHPLYHSLQKYAKKEHFSFYDIEKEELFHKEKKSSNLSIDCIFDFTLSIPEQKMGLLSHIDSEFDCPIVSDLSSSWGEMYFQKVHHLTGAVSTLFPSPTNKREAYFENEKTQFFITEVFQALDLTPFFVKEIEIGFTFPRILSMIINEAYFSLEDELANPEDIDQAMKYGVNYPLGPIEWSQEIGLSPILLLLDELYQATGDPRYRASKLLRLLAQNA